MGNVNKGAHWYFQFQSSHSSLSLRAGKPAHAGPQCDPPYCRSPHQGGVPVSLSTFPPFSMWSLSHLLWRSCIAGPQLFFRRNCSVCRWRWGIPGLPSWTPLHSWPFWMAGFPEGLFSACLHTKCTHSWTQTHWKLSCPIPTVLNYSNLNFWSIS